jgi:hypothetical protein
LPVSGPPAGVLEEFPPPQAVNINRSNATGIVASGLTVLSEEFIKIEDRIIP